MRASGTCAPRPSRPSLGLFGGYTGAGRLLHLPSILPMTMLRSHVLRLVVLVLLMQASRLAAQAPPAGFRDEFLRQFNNSSIKFIELAEAMPDSTYAWRPSEGVMPVAQVFAHVARYNYLYPQTGLGIAPPAGTDLERMEATTGKAEIVALLRQSREHVRTSVGRLSEADLARPTRLYGRDVQQWAVLFQLLAHMNEHLGQSIAYARSNGVVPPWSQ